MGNGKSVRAYQRVGGAGPSAPLPSNTQEYVAGSASRGYSVFRRSDGSYIAQLRGGKTVDVVKGPRGYRVKGVEGRNGKLGEYAKNEVAKANNVSGRAAARYIKSGDGTALDAAEADRIARRAKRTSPQSNNRRQRPQ